MLSNLPHRLRVSAGVVFALCGTLLCASHAIADNANLARPSCDAAVQLHADTTAPTGDASRTQCAMLLRVIGVAPNDVLFVRAEPRVPDDDEGSNKRIGIPADARGVHDLGPAATDSDWRLVRYLGVAGYARGKFLSADILMCSPAAHAGQEPAPIRRLDSNHGRHPAFE